MTKREPPPGGLLALHPAVIEVIETAVAEEVEQGIASVAPANVWCPTETSASRFTSQLSVGHAFVRDAWLG